MFSVFAGLRRNALGYLLPDRFYADAISLCMPRGMATKTGLDPANSGTWSTAQRQRVTGPPTDGQPNGIGIWQVQSWGTQTNSNSVTAAVYNHLGDFPYGTVAPTTYNYVGLGI